MLFHIHHVFMIKRLRICAQFDKRVSMKNRTLRGAFRNFYIIINRWYCAFIHSTVCMRSKWYWTCIQAWSLIWYMLFVMLQIRTHIQSEVLLHTCVSKTETQCYQIYKNRNISVIVLKIHEQSIKYSLFLILSLLICEMDYGSGLGSLTSFA